MQEVTCPTCEGCGQVVVPNSLVHDDGTVETWETADICYSCGGRRTVWL